MAFEPSLNILEKGNVNSCHYQSSLSSQVSCCRQDQRRNVILINMYDRHLHPV